MADVRASGQQAWSLNSTALKHIRDTGEDPPGIPILDPGGLDGLDLFDRDPFPIMTLKRSTGMHYELVPPLQPWSWRRMLNAMTDATLKQVVGPGIIGISCEPLPGSYDNARRHAAKVLKFVYAEDAPVPVWDFVVRRADGSRCRFHPSQTSSTIKISENLGAAIYERRGPTKGKGESDGRGTYRRMENNTYHESGAFRNPNPKYPAHLHPPKGKGKEGKGTKPSAASVLPRQQPPPSDEPNPNPLTRYPLVIPAVVRK